MDHNLYGSITCRLLKDDIDKAGGQDQIAGKSSAIDAGITAMQSVAATLNSEWVRLELDAKNHYPSCTDRTIAKIVSEDCPQLFRIACAT